MEQSIATGTAGTMAHRTPGQDGEIAMDEDGCGCWHTGKPPTTRGQRDDAAAALAGWVVTLGGSLESLGAPAGDVHGGTVGGEGLAGHEADAAAASCHDALEVLDAEESRDVEMVSLGHGGGGATLSQSRKVQEMDVGG